MVTLTRSQLEAVVTFASKFAGYSVQLEDAGDGRVVVYVVDEHGFPAGEKTLEPEQ
jgi:hypothetical protein